MGGGRLLKKKSQKEKKESFVMRDPPLEEGEGERGEEGKKI